MSLRLISIRSPSDRRLITDQVIVTPPGQTPPALSSDITSLGLRRNMGISADRYRELVADIMGSLDTESTYTFCFWGASRFADLINWNLKSLLPLGKSISLSTVLGNYVPHLVLYGLDERDGDSDRHVESRKTRYFEMIMWSTACISLPMSLPCISQVL